MGRALEQQLKERARALGFDACGIAPARLARAEGRGLEAFVRRCRHGSMTWLPATLSRRRDPRMLMPRAQTAVVCAMSHAPAPEHDPRRRARRKELANISIYALRRDYHDVLKGRLKHLAQWIVARTEADVKVFVDTAPLMERPLAELAGIGWRGKHTCVLSRELGNWFFIGVILTSAAMRPDTPASNHCGSCTRCLDICPTRAFTGPGRLDARRCISYLTIEHAGPIARSLRPLMGNRVFGCDDCLAVCPWNRFARQGREARLAMREELAGLGLAELLALDEPRWRGLFARTPVRRAGFGRFMANVLIACANTGAVPAARLRAMLEEGWMRDRPLARAMLVWALSRMLTTAEFAALRARHLETEEHPWARAEWLAVDERLR